MCSFATWTPPCHIVYDSHSFQAPGHRHRSLSLFSHSATSDSLQAHGLQLARLPCPSVSPRICLNSRPLGWWCHPTISSSSALFFFSSELALQTRWPSIGASASASVLPMDIQAWFPLGLTGLISWLSKGLSGVFSSTTVWKHQFFSTQPSWWSNSHIHTWLLEKLILKSFSWRYSEKHSLVEA